MIFIFANTEWYLSNFKKNLISSLAKTNSVESGVISIRSDVFSKLRSVSKNDIIISFTTETNIILSLYLPLRPCKIWICTINGIGRFDKVFLFKKMMAFLLKRANFIFVQNKTDFDFFKKNMGKEIFLTLGSGVEKNFMNMRHSMNNNRIKNIGFVGRLVNDKGFKKIIQLSLMIPEINFKVFGGSDKDVKILKKKYSEVNNLFFMGFIDNKIEIFDQIDLLLVIGTYGEGFPRAVLEAMARGVLVMCVDSGWNKGILIDGCNCIKTTSDHLQDIAKTIKSFDSKKFKASSPAIRRNAFNLVSESGSIDEIDLEYRALVSAHV